MYIIHLRIYGSLLNLFSTTHNLTQIDPHSVAGSGSGSTKSRSKSMLLTHPASIAIRTCVLNNKRTMSTSARPVSVRVYINSDQEKESIINENKGRSGIYR